VRGDPRQLAAVYAGGTIGALARAGFAEAWPTSPGTWPWPTFAVNLAGAALLAWFATRLTERLPPTPYRRPLLGTGLCGALTTFSTFQIELLRMLDRGHAGLAAAYAATTIAAGFALMFVVTKASRRARL
jgi:fluoride exporter